MKTQMIDKSNFDERQYKADLDSAYECGRASVIQIIDDIRAEIQENINYNKKMNYQGIVAGLLLTLEIIDKHIGGAE